VWYLLQLWVSPVAVVYYRNRGTQVHYFSKISAGARNPIFLPIPLHKHIKPLLFLRHQCICLPGMLTNTTTTITTNNFCDHCSTTTPTPTFPPSTPNPTFPRYCSYQLWWKKCTSHQKCRSLESWRKDRTQMKARRSTSPLDARVFVIMGLENL
jgi:hypothetical protein